MPSSRVIMGWRGLISRSCLPRRRRSRLLATALHDAAHAGGHELVAVQDHGGAVDKALRDAHFADFVAERLFEPLARSLAWSRRARLRFSR